MDFLVQALGGSAASSTAAEEAAGPGVAGSGAGAGIVGAQVPNGALGGSTVAAKGLDLSNLLSSNASLSGFGGPFAKGQSLEMFGDIPINSGQAHQMASPTQRRPQDDFLMSLFQ